MMVNYTILRGQRVEFPHYIVHLLSLQDLFYYKVEPVNHLMLHLIAVYIKSVACAKCKKLILMHAIRRQGAYDQPVHIHSLINTFNKQ